MRRCICTNTTVHYNDSHEAMAQDKFCGYALKSYQNL